MSAQPEVHSLAGRDNGHLQQRAPSLMHQAQHSSATDNSFSHMNPLRPAFHPNSFAPQSSLNPASETWVPSAQRVLNNLLQVRSKLLQLNWY